MAKTYKPIATVTASGVSTFVVMSSIPQTYTDLVLVGIFPKTATNSARITLNNDTSSLYSQTTLYGNGTSGLSGIETSAVRWFFVDFLQSSTSQPNMSITHFLNYSNTTTFKTAIDRSGVADKGTVVSALLYRSTLAITRIDIDTGSGTFSAGTTFTLYGIKAA